MKLRNKKTGEIGNFVSTNYSDPAITIMDDNGIQLTKYTSLAELNEEWEDYEEPKEYYWFIDDAGVVSIDEVLCSEINMRKSIGNYFETKEEAEKVVSLLKRIAIIKSYGCNVYEYINNTVLSVEDYYERNKDEKRICR